MEQFLRDFSELSFKGGIYLDVTTTIFKKRSFPWNIIYGNKPVTTTKEIFLANILSEENLLDRLKQNIKDAYLLLPSHGKGSTHAMVRFELRETKTRNVSLDIDYALSLKNFAKPT
jgi:hypothetical protein